MYLAFQRLKEPRELPFESDLERSCTKGDGAQTKQAEEGGVLSLKEEMTCLPPAAKAGFKAEDHRICHY